MLPFDFSDAAGKSLLIALSGGADSTALCCLLARARDPLDLTLRALHVHHGLRGCEADGDEAFCRDLCRRLGIPLSCVHVDVREQRLPGEGIETAARRLRYGALEAARRECNADWIALAHNQRDQAETVLMHLLRGCGPHGAGGMARQEGVKWRPLLEASPEALRAWLTAQGETWREDATNALADNPRNQIRLQLLPAIRGLYPKAESALSRFAEAQRIEDACLADLTERYLQEHMDTGPYGVRLRDIQRPDEAIRRRMLRRVFGEDLDHRTLLALSRLAASRRGRLTLPGGILAERTPAALYKLTEAAAPPASAPLQLRGETRLSGLGRLAAVPCDPVPVRDDPFRQVLDADVLAGCVLRTRRPGDRMRPLGSGDRLLSDILTDKKIDRPLRDFVPLIARGSRVLWLVGVAIAEEARLREGTLRAVQLQWKENTEPDHEEETP